MAEPSISKEELRDKLEHGNVQVINVLAPEHYALGMIQGSTAIPLKELESRLEELDQAREVITYCAGGECTASRQAADLLKRHGYKARAYEGGIEDWKEAGLPMEDAENPDEVMNAYVEADAASGLSGLPSERPDRKTP